MPRIAKRSTACSEQCAEVNTACSDRQTGLLLSLNPLSLNADEEKATAIKRRSAFKLLTELLLVGVYTDAAVLLTAVKSLASVDFHRDREAAQSALSLLASFAKSCREDILGLPNQAFSALSLQDADEVLMTSCANTCAYPSCMIFNQLVALLHDSDTQHVDLAGD